VAEAKATLDRRSFSESNDTTKTMAESLSVKTRLMRDVFLLRKMCQRPPIDHCPLLSFMSFTARGRKNKIRLKCKQVTDSRFAVSDPIEI
jgi:hypothetical protein